MCVCIDEHNAIAAAGQLAVAEFWQRQTFILAMRLRSSSLNSALDIRLNDKWSDNIACRAQSMAPNVQKKSLAVTLRMTTAAAAAAPFIFKPCK
jgi:hypothetical protein